jgi:hypothetical protein
MAELKPLSKESLSNALEMAKHYRLLNQPWQAESICRDILMVEADHQTALVQLILALTDQFGFEKSFPQASVFELCIQIKNKYKRT